MPPPVRDGHNKLCGSHRNMPRPSPPSVGTEAPGPAEPTAPDRNVAVGSHGEYVPTTTAAAAWCVNAAVSGLVTLTFDLLILKVVSESHVTWATFLCQFWSSSSYYY